MKAGEIKGLIMLIGLGSLGYGLYAAWSEYQQIAGLANMFLGTGTSARSMFDGLMGSMNMSLWDLVIKQPWVWVGVVLMAAPYVVGIGSGSSSRQADQGAPPAANIFVDCRSCGQPVRESAPFCPHCGSAR